MLRFRCNERGRVIGSGYLTFSKYVLCIKVVNLTSFFIRLLFFLSYAK